MCVPLPHTPSKNQQPTFLPSFHLKRRFAKPLAFHPKCRRGKRRSIGKSAPCGNRAHDDKAKGNAVYRLRYEGKADALKLHYRGRCHHFATQKCNKNQQQQIPPPPPLSLSFTHTHAHAHISLFSLLFIGFTKIEKRQQDEQQEKELTLTMLQHTTVEMTTLSARVN